MEVIEEALQQGKATCLAFLLLSPRARRRGRSDLDSSRAVARARDDRTLHDPDADATGAILALSWSRDGRKILAAAADGSITVWDAPSATPSSARRWTRPAAGALRPARSSPRRLPLRRRPHVPRPRPGFTLAPDARRHRAGEPRGPSRASARRRRGQNPATPRSANRRPRLPPIAAASPSWRRKPWTSSRVQSPGRDDRQAPELSKDGRTLWSSATRRVCELRRSRRDRWPTRETEPPPGSRRGAPAGRSRTRRAGTSGTPRCSRTTGGASSARARGRTSCTAGACATTRMRMGGAAVGRRRGWVRAFSRGDAGRVATGTREAKGVAQMAPHPTRPLCGAGANGAMYAWARRTTNWSAFEPGSCSSARTRCPSAEDEFGEVKRPLT